jgi:50S ribosomal protein L16 3-hydroxylase
VLARWLAPTTVDEFTRSHLQRLPYARPSAAMDARAACSWHTVERLFQNRPAPAFLAVRGAKLIDVPAPASLVDVQSLLRDGVAFVIRRTERYDSGLQSIATDFASDLPGEVHIQLFVTPAGSRGFGWHYDFEDVFIAQVEGTKRFYFRENTVDLDTPRDAVPDFAALARETTPLAGACLAPGDWIYLPTRWWHVARSVDDCISMSVGVYPAGRDL